MAPLSECVPRSVDNGACQRLTVGRYRFSANVSPVSPHQHPAPLQPPQHRPRTASARSSRRTADQPPRAWLRRRRRCRRRSSSGLRNRHADELRSGTLAADQQGVRLGRDRLALLLLRRSRQLCEHRPVRRVDQEHRGVAAQHRARPVGGERRVGDGRRRSAGRRLGDVGRDRSTSVAGSLIDRAAEQSLADQELRSSRRIDQQRLDIGRCRSHSVIG